MRISPKHQGAVLRSGPHLCPTLCNPMGRSPPGSSVHGASQARILEWIAILSSRGSSRPRGRNCISFISCTGGRVLLNGRYYQVAGRVPMCLGIQYKQPTPIPSFLFPTSLFQNQLKYPWVWKGNKGSDMTPGKPDVMFPTLWKQQLKWSVQSSVPLHRRRIQTFLCQL